MTQSLENHLMAPLPSGSKSEVIIQRITDALISGDLKPGDKIPTEQEFCDQLKIGRNTVREAIKVLIAFGVLEIRRSEGTFVVDHFSPKLMDSVLYGLILCPRSLDSLLEFKISLWTSMILLAIDKASDEDVAQLQLLYDALAKTVHASEPDVDAIFSDSEDFHRFLGEITHNPLMSQLNELTVNFSVNTRVQSISLRLEKGKLSDMLQEYAAMLELVRRRDKEAVPKTMASILAAWKILFEI
jgi:GntR family transcriptional repressor for pyruvate dehydrogenase complex